MAAKYVAGTNVTVTITVKDATGALADPSGLYLSYAYLSAQGILDEATVISVLEGSITRVSAGTYRAVIATDATQGGGALMLQGEAIGAVVAVSFPGTIQLLPPVLALH